MAREFASRPHPREDELNIPSHLTRQDPARQAELSIDRLLQKIRLAVDGNDMVPLDDPRPNDRKDEPTVEEQGFLAAAPPSIARAMGLLSLQGDLGIHQSVSAEEQPAHTL